MRENSISQSSMLRFVWSVVLFLAAGIGAACDSPLNPQDATGNDTSPASPTGDSIELPSDDNQYLELDDDDANTNGAYADDPAVANSAPVVIAEARILDDSTIELDGAATTDPDGDALTYSWRQSHGSPESAIESPASAVTFATIPAVSSDTVLTFTLTASDAENTSSATVEIELSVPIAPASVEVQLAIEASELSGEAPLSVEFTATTANGESLPTGALHWFFGDGTHADGFSVTHIFTAEGTYVVTLCSDDAATDCATTAVQVFAPAPALGGGGGGGGGGVVVTNQPPVAVAVANPTEATEGSTVLLDGSGSSDPDISPAALTYVWTQMQGTDVTGDPLFDPTSAQPQFTAPAYTGNAQQDTLIFNLVVDDGADFSAPASVSVTVTEDTGVPPELRNAGMPDSWLVLYNLNNADSIAWKDWYIQQWQIPVENTLGLNVDPNLERIQRDEFDNEIFMAVYDHLAADAELSAKIMGILVGYHVPGCFYQDDTWPENQSGGGWSVANKLQNLDPANLHTQLVIGNPHGMAVELDIYKPRVTKATLAANTYITARIDAPTLDDAKALTLRAKAITAGTVSLGAGDRIYYDYADPGSPGGDEWLKLRSGVESEALNTPAEDFPWRAFESDGAGEEDIPDCAFYFSYYRLTGWQNAPWGGTPAGPRVLAFALNSFGATTVRSTVDHSGRFVPNALFTGGFAGAVGATAEPYVSNSPYPGTMVWCLRDGRTMGESVFHANQRAAWMWELVGDPLLTVPNWFAP